MLIFFLFFFFTLKRNLLYKKEVWHFNVSVTIKLPSCKHSREFQNAAKPVTNNSRIEQKNQQLLVHGPRQLLSRHDEMNPPKEKGHVYVTTLGCSQTMLMLD